MSIENKPDGFYCRLCPRRCGAFRSSTLTGGICNSPSTAMVSLASLHMWEEPPISGSKGSGTVFFTGCGLGCVYCQNHVISVGGCGKPYTPEQLAQQFRSLEEQGAHNISLVTATQFIPELIKAMRIYRPRVVVWNSGGYESAAAINAIAPYVDVWLPDYKYALKDCAEKYSSAPDYPEAALAAIERMVQYQPNNVFDEDGLITKGVIIRHLVLPLNTRNSIAALDVLHSRFPSVPISIMGQYTPVVKNTGFCELERPITRREYRKVVDHAAELGIEGYMQALSSSGEGCIPSFEI